MREGREPWQIPASERREISTEYVPPVGRGSKSVPSNSDYRDLPHGLIPPIERIDDK